MMPFVHLPRSLALLRAKAASPRRTTSLLLGLAAGLAARCGHLGLRTLRPSRRIRTRRRFGLRRRATQPFQRHSVRSLATDLVILRETGVRGHARGRLVVVWREPDLLSAHATPALGPHPRPALLFGATYPRGDRSLAPCPAHDLSLFLFHRAVVILLRDQRIRAVHWALSLCFLVRHVRGGSRRDYLLAYGSLLRGLLSLAILIPLLVVTAAAPIVLDGTKRGGGRAPAKMARAYGAPVAACALFYLVFQTCIASSYQTEYAATYGVAPLSAGSILQAVYFFFALGVELPLMLVEATPHVLRWRLGLIAIAIAAFILLLRDREHPWTGRAPSLCHRAWVGCLQLP